MADLFGRTEQVYAGGLTSDASYMFWDGLPNGGLGLLITQMAIQYQQPVRRIFEIGPWTSVGGAVGQPVYYVAGRPEGTLQLSRIAGPIAALGGFYKRYGSVCSFLNNLFFVSSTGCLSGNTNTLQTLPSINNPPAVPPIGSTGSTGRVGGGRQDPWLGWWMGGVVITSVGLSAQAQDMMVAENVQLMFVALKLYTADANLAFPGQPQNWVPV